MTNCDRIAPRTTQCYTQSNNIFDRRNFWTFISSLLNFSFKTTLITFMNNTNIIRMDFNFFLEWLLGKCNDKNSCKTTAHTNYIIFSDLFFKPEIKENRCPKWHCIKYNICNEHRQELKWIHQETKLANTWTTSPEQCKSQIPWNILKYVFLRIYSWQDSRHKVWGCSQEAKV